jgi:hypothetical protein
MEQQNPQVTPSVKPPLISLNDLFSGTWQFWQVNLKKLTAISTVVAVPGILGQLINLIGGEDLSSTFGTIIFILAVLSIFISILGSIALIEYAKKAQPTKSLTQIYKAAGSKFWSYLLIGILSGLATLAGFIFLVLPGLAIAIYFSLAIYVFVDEGLTGTEALKRSYHLVKNYWWATFGRLAVLGLVLIVISVILNIFIAIPVAGPWVYIILINIFYILMTPFSTVYGFKLYRNIRAVKGLEINKDLQVNR